VFRTPGEQNLKTGGGRYKFLSIQSGFLSLQTPPVNGTKAGHVHKTPYFVHEGGVMYKFFVESDKAMLFVTPHNFSVTVAPLVWRKPETDNLR
jgi:hypothetical protein